MSNGKPGFFSEVLSPGRLLLITATMREGKSNVASYLIENGVPLGYNFYTNMLFYDLDELDEAIAEGILKQKKEHYRRVPPEVHTITTMSELILGINSSRKNITLLDEALLFANSKKGTSKDIRWFEGLVTQIGKFDSSIGLIAQAKSKLATLLKEDIPSYELKVKKISYYNRYVEIWFNPPQSSGDAEDPYKVDERGHIPPTRYPYDTYAPAGFEFDIDMEDFVNKISKMKTLIVRKQIPDIIANMLKDSKKQIQKKRTVKDLIVDMLQEKPDLSDEEIMLNLKQENRKCTIPYINRLKKEIGIFSTF